MRCLLGLFLILTVSAQEGHRFEVNKVSVYTYSLQQEQILQSAGDEIRQVMAMEWLFTLVPQQVSEERADLAMKIYLIKASLDGPMGTRTLSSDNENDKDDPLLGHTLALAGITLQLTVDPRTGTVHQVSGEEAIIDALKKQLPITASALIKQAEKLYSSDRLAALWTTILACPRLGVEIVPLDPPAQGHAERHWQDSSYTLKLPEGGRQPVIELHTDPTPVQLTIQQLHGSGSVQLNQGHLVAAEGSMQCHIVGQAMMQNIGQDHLVRWSLTWNTKDISEVLRASQQGPGPSTDMTDPAINPLTDQSASEP